MIFIQRLIKKRHFKKKIRITEMKMWDIEFLKTKLKEEREGLRLEHDRLSEMVMAANERLENEKKKEDPDKTIIENLENLKRRFEPDIEHLTTQISGIDAQLQGSNQGEGLDQLIESHRALIDLLKYHRKQI